MNTASSPGLRPLELAGLGLLAALARTFNLGSFSLWLDEILLMLRARGGPAEVWAACRANAEHPPLSALAMSVLNAAGVSETGHRLLPAALGVATVLLLAVWTARRFGRTAGLMTGLVTALLPFHVRYSQEVRPYSYLLFFAALTLVAADRLERRPGLGAVALAFAALLGGFYSHNLFALILVPALWPLAEAALARDPGRRSTGRRALGTFLAAAAAALLAYLPWLAPTLGELARRPPHGGVKPWTWTRLFQRWQFLTVGGVEGDPLTWAGALALALALLGALVAWRSAAGRGALAGVLLGTLAVELFLLAANHWSNGRYNVLGWLFLPVLIGLGIARLATARRTRPLAAAALAALLLGEAAGLARYARIGRPDWDRLAAAVHRVRRPGEPVLAENEWTRISLGYYLQGPDFQHRSGEDGAPVVVGDRIRRLRQLWPADRAALLVVSGAPPQRRLRQWSRAFPHIGHFRRSQARVVLLTPEVRQRLFDSGARAVGPAASGAPPAGDRAVRLAPVVPPASWLERLGKGPW